jgi:ankyrin repeat protein
MKIINRYVLVALLFSCNISFTGVVNEAHIRANQSLIKASERNDLATVQKNLAEGAEINAKDRSGCTALMRGINNKTIVKILLKHGANVDAQERHGETALMLAVRRDRLDIVKLLVENMANLNIKNNGGDTALMMASKGNSTKMVEFLLYYGANVHVRNKAGFTAFRLAKNEKTKLELQKFMARAA